MNWGFSSLSNGATTSQRHFELNKPSVNFFHSFTPKYWSYFRIQFSWIKSKRNCSKPLSLCYTFTAYLKIKFCEPKKKKDSFSCLILFRSMNSKQEAIVASSSREEFTLIICLRFIFFSPALLWEFQGRYWITILTKLY